jgi:hypothetical protein
MSEYQWYEFLSLDKPLSEKQIAEVRRLSSRAEISPTRFWNEYHWGDFKGDPDKLMERTYDAHLYFSSWRAQRLMLRMPVARVDERALLPYLRGRSGPARIAGAYVILDIESEVDWAEAEEDGGGLLQEILPVRAELMRGDLRVAYLAWLINMQADDADEEEIEPPVPPGLGDLTPAQEAMIDFLRLDGDLLDAAAEGATEVVADEAEMLRQWVLALPAEQKDAWLLSAVADPDLALGGELLRTLRSQTAAPKTTGTRTFAEICARANVLEREREHREAEEAENEVRAAAVARNRALDQLAANGDEAWTKLEQLIAKRAFVEATALGLDLRALAARSQASTAFKTRMDALRKRLGSAPFTKRWLQAVREAEGGATDTGSTPKTNTKTKAES